MADGMDEVGASGVILLEEDDTATPARPEEAGVVVLQDDGKLEEPLPERAVVMNDGTIKLPLLHPVTLRFKKRSSPEVREETTSELHFRRLKGPDMRAIAAVSGSGAFAAVLLARSAQIPEGKFSAIYDQMDGEDITDATAVVGRFLTSGRKTGR